jgi:signal transduction histidine kinase
MGRLYWKFFIFFFLAQLTAVTVVALWMANQNQAHLNAQVETSPPARSLVDATAVTLQYGGVEGMRALLQRWSQQPMPQVYAVNEQQTELLNRHLPTDVIQNARAIFNRQQAENAMLDRAYAPKEPVQKIKANDQHEYLLFVPVKHLRVPQNMPQRSIFGFYVNPRDKHLFPLMPLLAGALASFIFAAILAWYFSKPITTLRQAFASAANGNLDVRVSASMGSRRDELADLGKAFDGMATRLGVLLQSQTRLLHQVSHELRSPLARLQIAVGLARQQPDKLASSLNRIERESERMDDLVGELLALSRLESGVINLEKESINLNELLLTVVEDARFEGDAKQISIDYEPLDHASTSNAASEQVTLLGQQDLLHRAIDNVVRNALKFSASQSHIAIKTSVENKIITITVRDQGLGVDKAELDMIFQAFFRGSNTNQTDGHGVGLAMARQIIEAHGGAIVANNQPAGGLCVTITLPKVE